MSVHHHLCTNRVSLRLLPLGVRPACTSDKVYLIDHGMPKGEYFLAEYRDACGFDAELRHHSTERGRDRRGMALWHVDESGLMPITFTSEGYPGDGKNPRKHYQVALAQADGDWDLEKGRNRGDSTDLFIKSSDPWKANVAYKITPDGLILNNGQLKPGVNTNSYANNGKEKYTGIEIEFGFAGSSMTMTVTLDGAIEVQPSPTPVPPTPVPPTPVPPTPVPPTPTPPIQDVGRNKSGNVPVECTGKAGTRICYTGVGRKKNKIQYRGCNYIKRKRILDKVCNLNDLSEPDIMRVSGYKLIREKCTKACARIPRI